MRAILLATIAGLLAACRSDPSALEPGKGELQYRATTSTGLPLLEGRLSLTLPTDSTVAGTWQIHRTAVADTTIPVGPQVGAGTLIGTRRGDTLILELNPAYADNNVSLRGVAKSSGLRGDWTWTTLTGPRASGRFAAVPD